MPIRPNILTNPTARTQYVGGCIALKSQFTGVTTATLGISGPSRPVSTWDRFVAWHHSAMGIAHRTPLFLPWHRMMLRTLERLIATAVGNPAFGLPYWDWAADGQLTPAQQLTSNVWNNNCMGSAASGPGSFTLAAFPIRLATNMSASLVQVNRALRRERGLVINDLPTKPNVQGCLTQTPYDAPMWNIAAVGFRNRVEGWFVPRPQLHNRVHVWVGGNLGDMSPSSSPNDPIFYLNHCNIDRIWEAWMVANGRQYQPGATTGPAGQRINSPMPSPFAPAPFLKPAQVLNMTAVYTYDNLTV